MQMVVGSVETTVRGKRLLVPNIELEECPHCGERLYDLAALRKIRAARRPPRRKRAA
jgi:YgiT-type zinc finger domain-containing protein